MKIIHTEASKGWGGQEIRILKEALGMRERGHDIVFITEYGSTLNQKAKENNFKSYSLSFNKLNWLFSFFKLLKIFKKEKADIVNTHSSLDAWIAAIAARVVKIPIIRTRHLSAKVKKGVNSKIVYNYLADFVITTCAKIIPVLSSQSKKPLKFFSSIPTGIDTNEIKTSKEAVLAFREKYNIKNSDILIGMVCFMRSWKGIEDFFQAAYHLKDKKSLKWIIIGKGHIETYKQKAKEYHVDDKIIFTGHIEKPYNAIAALDVFVLLSTANEGVSQASLQSAFLKKPLITTSTGGLDEVCIDGKTGFLVPCFSYKEVSKAVLRLEKDAKMREKFGEKAHQLVLKKFLSQKMLDDVEKIYQSIK